MGFIADFAEGKQEAVKPATKEQAKPHNLKCHFCQVYFHGEPGMEFCSEKCFKRWSADQAAIRRMNGHDEPTTFDELNDRIERSLRRKR